MSAKAFNEVMVQFLGDLAASFPDEPMIKEVQANPSDLATFMKQVSPWSDKMTAKDESFFSEENLFAKSLNLHVIWKTEGATPRTKDAIWQYLSSLFFMGTMQNMFPPEMMAMIESTAENLAKNLQTTGGEIDPRTIQNMASQIVNGGMLGGLGLGPPPQRRRTQKPSKKSR